MPSLRDNFGFRLQEERLELDLWILCLMECLTGKLKESRYNELSETQNEGGTLKYEELWRTLRKKGSRLHEDHYRNWLENFRTIKKSFLEEVQPGRQDSELPVQEAWSAGEVPPEG